MAAKSASKASFIAAAASMAVWVIIEGKCMIAFCKDCEGWKVAVASGWFIANAIPFGLIIGYIVAPVIYMGCNLTGLRRYAQTIYVHIIAGTAIGVTFLVLDRFQLYTGLWLVVAYPVMVSILCAPWVTVPSLIGTLAYARWSRPATQGDGC